MSSRLLRPTSAPAITLGEIARGLGLAHEGDDVSVTGVALHTQAVMLGDVFVALQGVNRHGSEMVDEALAQGAVAVFTDAGHQIDAAFRHAAAALLDTESLAPEKLTDQVFEFAPRQMLQ